MPMTPAGVYACSASPRSSAALVARADVRGAAVRRRGARRRARSCAAPATRRRCCRRRCRKRSTKLKAQERATAARAEASERLSGEIISSLTAGLLVVGLNGEVRILNPAGRRMLRSARSGAAPTIIGGSLARAAAARRHRRVPARPALPIVRRGGACCPTAATASTHLGVTVSPLFDDAGRAARRDLPLHRSHRGQGPRGAAAAEGEPRDGRRADGRASRTSSATAWRRFTATASCST